MHSSYNYNYFAELKQVKWKGFENTSLCVTCHEYAAWLLCARRIILCFCFHILTGSSWCLVPVVKYGSLYLAIGYEIVLRLICLKMSFKFYFRPQLAGNYSYQNVIPFVFFWFESCISKHQL